MTEKRFKQLTEKGFRHAFIDTQNLDISYICDNPNDCKNIVELLNALHEENIELQSRIGVTFDVNDRLHKENVKLHEENQTIRQTIQEAYESERTQIGRNVLKQLLEAIQ